MEYGKITEGASAILLVVDDDSNRFTLSGRLKREGFTNLTEARNGREAIAMLREKAFDLVLLDVMMPDMDGYEVLRNLKADMALRDIPVVMISAVDAVDSVVRCIELGAEDYLPKPFNAVLLKARVSATLQRKRLRDQKASYLKLIEDEKRRADGLLRAVLPPGAIQELKATNVVKPRRYEGVAVLFCDIVQFTAYCDQNPPEQVVAELQALVERFEQIVTSNGMEKIRRSATRCWRPRVCCSRSTIPCSRACAAGSP
jgi:DNA-binding response OmpR family regulator